LGVGVGRIAPRLVHVVAMAVAGGLADSDGESSGGDAQPRFRAAPAPGGGRRSGGGAGRAKGRKTRLAKLEDAVLDALQGDSSDGEGPPPARAAAASGSSKAAATERQRKRAKHKPEPAETPPPQAAGRGGKTKELASAVPPAAPPPPKEADIEAEAAAFIAAANREAGLPRRRLVKKGPRSRVVPEPQGAPRKGGGDSSGSETGARFRTREQVAGGDRGGGGMREDEDDASEGEPDEEQVNEWKADLLTRTTERDRQDLRSAFSIKECPAVAIRTLDAACFLGRRRLEDGGRPLFDNEGKVNLHFLLGTYRGALMAKQKRKAGKDAPGKIDPAEHSYLRWLIRQARQLKLINSAEMRRGRIGAKRILAIRKSGKLSMTLDANLAEASDQERGAGQDNNSPTKQELEAAAAAAGQFEASFPERKDPGPQKDSGVIRNSLRSKVISRKELINTSTSHDVDLNKMHDILTAPSFSFDWEAKAEEDDTGLEVDLPETELREARRNIFRDQLSKQVSFHQANKLARSDRSLSSKSLAGSAPEAPGEASEGQTAAAPKGGGDDARAGTSDKTQGEARPSMPGTSTPKSHSSPSTAPLALRLGSKAARRAPAPGGATPEAPRPDTEQPRAAGRSGAATAVAATAVEATAPRQALPPVAPAAPVAPVAPDVHVAPVVPAESAVTPKVDAVPAPATAEFASTAPAVAAAAEEADCTADTAPTQDWPDEITPTAMWGPVSPSRKPVQPQAGTGSGGAAAKGSLEISPTLPFEPLDAKKSLEISPTMPFVPMDMPAAKGPLEISPTMPFVPMEAAAAAGSMEISPTLPFVPMEVAVGKDLPEISPTMPFVPQEHTVPSESTAPRGETVAEGKQPAAAPEAQHRKRSPTQLSEDSPSSEEGDSEGVGEDGLAVPLTEAERKRRRQEREWLRHKRRALRREEGLARRREAAVVNKAAGRLAAAGAGSAAVLDLGAAAMSREEQSRFQALVADGPGDGLKGAAIATKRLGGLSAFAGADDDEGLMLLGTLGGAPRKSRRLFGGAAAGS